MVLRREHYDARYYDGRSQEYAHNAGYGQYVDRGFKEQAQWLVDNFNLVGKKLLDIGCAKGFLVGHLRDLGVDAYGMDWSEYAIGEAEPALKDYLFVGNALEETLVVGNSLEDILREWDYLISARVLICINPRNIKKVVGLFNKAAKKQIHFIDLTPNPDYYVAKPLKWWAKQGFKKGTVLIGDSYNNQLKI